MSRIKLITVTSQPERAKELIESAQKHGWDIHVIETEWRGFGTKIIQTVKFLKDNPGIKEFVFCDAHDVVVLGTEEEFNKKLRSFSGRGFIYSAEKGCWPDPKYRSRYAEFSHGFSFLNSGLYYVVDTVNFIQMIKNTPLEYYTDDQLYFTERYFDGYGSALDHEQTIFNSHSFIAEGEYGYENGRVQIMGNEPIFIHLNGGTIDEKLNQMLNDATATQG